MIKEIKQIKLIKEKSLEYKLGYMQGSFETKPPKEPSIDYIKGYRKGARASTTDYSKKGAAMKYLWTFAMISGFAFLALICWGAFWFWVAAPLFVTIP